MNRTAVGFVLGYLLGFAGLYVVFVLAVRILEGSDMEAAGRRNMSLETYQQWIEAKYERPFLLAAGVAAAVLGVLGAHGFNRPITRDRLTSDRRDDGEPFTRDETLQVLQVCGWVPLDERSTEFVRGLAVGRLAESHPALARKVDDCSDTRMAALHRDLCRRRARGV